MSNNLLSDRLKASSGPIFHDGLNTTVLVVLAAIVLAISYTFWHALGNLWFRWGQSEELSHSFFIPLITGWLIWESRKNMMMSIGKPSATGLILVVLGLFLNFVGALTHIFVLQHLGFMTILFALPLLLGGTSLFIALLLPIGYMLFMVPPPYWVITVLSGKLQLISSSLGVSVIRLWDIPVYLSGNVIDLPSTTLAVVEACSGLRYLFPLLSLGALAAYFYKGPVWQRIFIFMTTVPITILMNSFRIAFTGVAIEKFGGNHTEGLLHFFEGWVVFVMCLMMLMIVIWVFTLIRGYKNPLHFIGVQELKAVKPGGIWDQKLFVRNSAILVAALMIAGFFTHNVSNNLLIIPEREEFSGLLFEFPGWKIRESYLSPDIEETLGADDYIVMDMTNDEGEMVNIYMAYLESQRDGRSWHSPRQCLPGGGWQMASHQTETTQRLDGREYSQNRIIIEKGDERLLVYYWYEQRGRKVANEFKMKFTVMYDAVTKSRTDGALIRLITPIGSNEHVADAEARLDSMKAQIEPLLPKYVPE